MTFEVTVVPINAKLEGKGDAPDVTFEQMEAFLKDLHKQETIKRGWVVYCLKYINVHQDDQCFYK
jgi:hypothetical protein